MRLGPLSVSLQAAGAAEHPDRQLEAIMQAEAAEEQPPPIDPAAATDDTTARIACLTNLLRVPVVPYIDQQTAVTGTQHASESVSLCAHDSSCQPHPCIAVSCDCCPHRCML